MLVTITLSCIVDNVRALCKVCFVSITKRFLHNAMISGFIILSLSLSLFISFRGIVGISTSESSHFLAHGIAIQSLSLSLLSSHYSISRTCKEPRIQ